MLFTKLLLDLKFYVEMYLKIKNLKKISLL